jgi:hypothetical protein
MPAGSGSFVIPASQRTPQNEDSSLPSGCRRAPGGDLLVAPAVAVQDGGAATEPLPAEHNRVDVLRVDYLHIEELDWATCGRLRNLFDHRRCRVIRR